MAENMVTYKMLKKAVRELKKHGVYTSIPFRCIGPDGKVHYFECKSIPDMKEKYCKLWEGHEGEEGWVSWE